MFASAIRNAGGARLANKELAVVEKLVVELWGWIEMFVPLNTVFRFLYPFVGGNAIAHSFNLADPATARITWGGTVTHNANGITGNGSTGYGDTGVAPGSSLVSAGVYSRTSAAVDSSELSNGGSGSGTIAIGCRWSDDNAYFYNGQPLASFVNAGSQGTCGNTGGNITLDAPSSPQVNDIWIAAIHTADHVAPVFSGWNAITSFSGGGTLSHLAIFWFRYAGTVPNLVYTHTGGSSGVGCIAAFRGLLEFGTPIITTSVNSGTVNPVVAPSISPGVSMALAILACGGSAPSTTVSGWSSAFHATQGGTPASGASLRFKSHSSGGTGSVSVNSPTSDPDWAAAQTALQLSDGIFVKAAATDGRGLFSLQRTTSNLLRGYRNGAQVGSDVTSSLSTFSSANFNILREPTPGAYSNRNLAFAFLTGSQSITSKQAELYTIIQNFQTRLGRQV
jgi:hypothetical protein